MVSGKSLRVLILHEDKSEAARLVAELSQAGYAPVWERLETHGDFLDRLAVPWQTPPFDVILANGRLPKMDGMAALRTLRSSWQDIPFVFVTRPMGEEFAVECFRQGADDYLWSDRLERLGEVVGNALERKRRKQADFGLDWDLEHLFQVAGALVWSATVEERNGRLHWTYHADKERVTAHFLAVERRPERTYVEAWNSVIVPTDRKRAQQTARQALREGVPGYEQEFSCVDVRSSVHHFREKVRVERLGAGKWRLFGVWTDITEMKRAQESGVSNLHQQIERLLLHVMSSVHCLLWHATIRRWKSGMFVWQVLPINQEAAQQFFPLDVFPETTYFDSRWTAMHPEDRDRISRVGQEIPESGGKRYHQEYRCRSRSGEWRWFRDDVVLEPAGKDRWWAVGVSTDITDIKEEQAKIQELNEALEERVQERTSRLEEANRDLRRMAEQSRELSRQLVEIQEQERRSLARELHDEVGQWLTGLKFAIEAVEQRSDDASRQVLTEARKSLQELMQRVQSISTNLRPPMLDILGIFPTLRGHIERYRQQTGVQVVFSCAEPTQRYTPEIELAIFRFVQEGLNNVARHARTTQATVKMTHRGGSVIVSVTDIGVGFDAAAVMSGAERFGLLGLRERMSLLGGKMEVRSSAGKGTRLSVRIPKAFASERKPTFRMPHPSKDSPSAE